MNEFTDNRGHPQSLYDKLDEIYLRVSLTDACNFRCQYCMPAAGYPEQKRSGQASDTELLRLISLISSVRKPHKVRLTGGEPLLRKSIVSIAEQIKSMLPESGLALTTNGVLLPKYAHDLKAAGVDSINISLDSMDTERFAKLARRDQMQQTMDGVDAALEAGFRVKLNTVLIRSNMEAGVLDLVDYAAGKNLELRFIELMPLGEGTKLHPREFIDADEVLEIIRQQYSPLDDLPDGATSQRLLLRSEDGREVTLGFIRTMSKPFCGECDRLRLDSHGQLFTCIRSVFGRPLLAHLRRGDEDKVRKLVTEAIHGKIIPDETWPEYRSMVAIGG